MWMSNDLITFFVNSFNAHFSTRTFFRFVMPNDVDYIHLHKSMKMYDSNTNFNICNVSVGWSSTCDSTPSSGTTCHIHSLFVKCAFDYIHSQTAIIFCCNKSFRKSVFILSIPLRLLLRINSFLFLFHRNNNNKKFYSDANISIVWTNSTIFRTKEKKIWENERNEKKAINISVLVYVTLFKWWAQWNHECQNENRKYIMLLSSILLLTNKTDQNQIFD